MKLKLNTTMAAAAVLLTTTGANANFAFAVPTGNSSAAFVAITNDGTLSLAVNLGVFMTDFLAGPGTQGVPAGATTFAGSLSSPSAVGRWNFSANTFTINGATQAGTNSWGAVGSFMAAAAGLGGYKWGVIAADGITVGSGAANPVQGQNLLFTGTNVDYTLGVDGINNSTMGGGTGGVSEFYAANNLIGTHAPGVRGASTATAGVAFLGTQLVQGGIGMFGQDFGFNDFLNDPGTVSRFTWATTGPGFTSTAIYSIGAVYGAGADSLIPATFTWDAANSTLIYAVPEPGTYALFLAGMVGVAVMVRRRRSQSQ